MPGRRGAAVCLLLTLGASASFADGEFARPEFAAPLRLEAAGEALDTGAMHASPCAWDWNGDGRMDLLVGRSGGRLHYYVNRGVPRAPSLAEGTPVVAEGEAVAVPPG